VGLALLTLICYLIGNRIIGRIAYSSGAEKFCFCTALGLGTIANLVLGLGLLHWLTRGVILTLFLVIALVLGQPWRLGQELNRILQRLKSRRAFVYGLIALVLIPLLLLPLYPPTQWDATSYHLAAAKIYAKSQAVVFTPYLRFPVFPQLNEMLFTLMLIVYDDISAQLVQFLAMVLVGTALYAWGRRAFNSRVGLFAAVLWVSNPIVLWLGASAYIDAGMVLLVLLAVYAFFNWFQLRSREWLLLSAALFGFAAGSKYLALVHLAACGIFLLCVSLKDRKIKELILFVLMVAAVASPWYIRNIYYTHNPVWPYFASRLGNGTWTPDDVKSQLQEQASYGLGRGPIALAVLPWNLAFHAPLFHADPGSLSPAYLLLLPLAFMVAARSAYLRAVLLAVGLYTLFWFSTVQVLRYLVPAIPFSSLAGAAALENMLSRLPELRKTLIQQALNAIVCVVLLAVGWARGATLIPSSLPPATAPQRVSYLRRFLPLYPAYEFLNGTKGNKYSVYALDCSNMAYFADGIFMGDWFGPARYSLLLSHLSRPQELYAQLRALGADYLLIPKTGDFLNTDTTDSFLAPGFLEGKLKLVYADSRALLFAVQDRGVRLDNSPELLRNTGFEDVYGAQPAFWLAFGKPLTDSTGNNSHGGRTAVQSDAHDWVSQRVQIESGHIYLLRNFSHAKEPKQFARLQINWLDRERKLLSADIEVVPEASEWRSHSMAVTAPAHACWAEVYASVHEDSRIWFDDFSFVELKYR
jgi:4-amino-4-deoxy-L-arabinose transferase-like glycosyltransferase